MVVNLSVLLAQGLNMPYHISPKMYPHWSQKSKFPKTVCQLCEALSGAAALGNWESQPVNEIIAPVIIAIPKNNPSR